jgi:hypothetical protein
MGDGVRVCYIKFDSVEQRMMWDRRSRNLTLGRPEIARQRLFAREDRLRFSLSSTGSK